MSKWTTVGWNQPSSSLDENSDLLGSGTRSSSSSTWSSLWKLSSSSSSKFGYSSTTSSSSNENNNNDNNNESNENNVLSPSITYNKTSMLLTACNFMNGVVGAGIIGLPGAINEAGFILGILMCLIVAIVSAWTIRLLAEVGIAHGVYTYPDLCQRAFGPPGYFIVCIFQGLFAFGAMCSYLVIFADTVPQVLKEITDWKNTSPSAIDRTNILIVGSLLILFPLSLIRQYAQLAKLSVIKFFAITFLTGTVVYFRFILKDEVASVKNDTWKYEEVHASPFPALGTIAFAFVCHHQTFLALGSLQNPTIRRFTVTINMAITGSLILSLLLGIFGYITFWETTKGDIFINYESFASVRSNGIMNTARLFVALNMLITYPSEMMVARNTIEGLIERRRRHLRWIALQAPVHDVQLLAQLRQQEIADAALSADAWTWGKRPTRAVLEHVGITILLYGASLIIACTVKDLSKVLNFTGSITAVSLAFVLPAAIRLRLGAHPYDENPIFHPSNFMSGIVLVFGAVAFIASTGLSVVSAAGG